MLRNYIVIALRNLLKNKTVSFINIFGLAISMSVCLLLIIIIMDQLSYDDFHQNGDRTYRVVTTRMQDKQYVWKTATVPMPLVDMLETHDRIEKITRIRNGFSGVASTEAVDIPFKGLYTDNAFLQIFDFPLESGHKATVFTTPNSMVLTHDLATRLFGDNDPINKVLKVEGVGEFTVTGVLKENPGKSHIDFEALASLEYAYGLEKENKIMASRDNWDNVYSNYTYFLMKEGSDMSDVMPLLRSASAHYPEDSRFKYQFDPQRLSSITPGYSYSNPIGVFIPDFIIRFLVDLAAVVLLAACFNYTNLTTARTVNRAREIGVRKVAGARRWQIMLQFVVEAVIVSLIAFVFADLLVQYLHPRFNGFLLSLGAPFQIDETPHLYWLFVVFAVSTGLLAGFFPALFLSKTNVLEALKKSVDPGRLTRTMRVRKFDMRKVLVVLQFAFSVFFVITVTTLYRQMDFVMNAGHNFRIESVVKMSLQGIDYEGFRARLGQHSDITHITAASHLPALGHNITVDAQANDIEKPLTLDYFSVDAGYFDALDIRLIAGRDFPSNTDTAREESFIILNEKAVHDLGWENTLDALGETVSVNERDLEVIGIVEDHHYMRLNQKTGALGFRNLPSRFNHVVATLNSMRSTEALEIIESEWGQVTNRPFEYIMYEDDMRSSYGMFTALIGILGYITLIVVSIACLGLLGIVIYHVQNKSKEIGVRKVLGATAGNILFMITKGFLILMSIAYLIGGPLAYLVNDRWLSSYVQRVGFGVGTISIGFAGVLAVVLVTVGSQLYRAMKINPADSLRDE